MLEIVPSCWLVVFMDVVRESTEDLGYPKALCRQLDSDCIVAGWLEYASAGVSDGEREGVVGNDTPRCEESFERL